MASYTFSFRDGLYYIEGVNTLGYPWSWVTDDKEKALTMWKGLQEFCVETGADATFKKVDSP